MLSANARVMMRTASVALLVAFTVFAAGKPDFTGTWVCNVAKSKMGKISKIQGMTLKVERKGEVLHASQTIDDGQGGKSIESDWFMDGKQHPVDMSATVNKMTSMSRWDGNTIVAQKKSDDGSYVEDMKIVFSNGDKTATERVAVKSPNGNTTSTLVFEKK